MYAFLLISQVIKAEKTLVHLPTCNLKE